MWLYSINWDKSNLDSASTSESSSNVSAVSNIVSAVTKNIQTIKKSSYYHIHVAETKKRLDAIYEKIESLINSSEDISWKIQGLYSDLSLVSTQIHNLNLEYDEQVVSLDLSLTFYWITDKNVLYDGQLMTKFLHTYTDEYISHLSISNHEKVKEKQEIRNATYKVLIELVTIDNAILIKQETIKKIEKRKDDIKKEIINLEKEYADLQNTIKSEQKQYQETHKQWLLKSYESDKFSVSINHFVANPSVEAKVKEIISMYKNPEIVKQYNISLPKSILLLWNSDTGKTYTAKLLSSELQRKMYHIHTYDLLTEDFEWPKPLYILDAIVEETQKTKEPCIIFLDNLEKIVDLSWVIENVLMKHLLNIQKSDLDIIVMAALGERQKISGPDIINNNMFPLQICFSLPKQEEKRKLLDIYTKDSDTDFFSNISIDDLLTETNKINHNVSAQHLKRFVFAAKSLCVSRKITWEADYKLTLDDVRWIVLSIRQEDKQNGRLKYFQ